MLHPVVVFIWPVRLLHGDQLTHAGEHGLAFGILLGKALFLGNGRHQAGAQFRGGGQQGCLLGRIMQLKGHRADAADGGVAQTAQEAQQIAFELRHSRGRRR